MTTTDINNDGTTDSADVFAWIRVPVDVNGDGVVNQSDVLAIVEAMNPVADDGWTKLTRSNDTQTIYVSVDGNDMNTGTSPDEPLRTVAAGYRKLRDGKPDWLLIRRGDTFGESFRSFNKSGRSETEPMVVTTYGHGERPILRTPDRGVGMSGDRKTRQHVAFVGLHLEPQGRGQAQGFRFTANTTADILIEDCYIANYKVGISLDVAASSGSMSDIRIRRNIIVDNHNDSHAQGIFANRVNGLLIEGNVFDRNGWDHQIGRDDATIFAHNVYVQRGCRDVVFVDNVSCRASSHGLQLRPGGVAEGNVCIENAVGLLFANDSRDTAGDDRVAGNLILHGIDLNGDEPRGWGLHLQDIRRAVVEGNIVAQADSSSGWGLSITSTDRRDVVDGLMIRGNVIHDHGIALQINPDLVRSAVFTDNTFSAGALIEWRRDGKGGTEFAGNSWRGRDADETIAADDPQGQTFSGFVNEDATIDAYARQVGYANRDEFYEGLRRQRRGNWRENLTARSIRAWFREAFQTV